MRHLPFFEALAANADEPHNSLWHEFQAAVVILRYLRDWVESPTLARGTDQGITLLKQHISATQDPIAKSLLNAMLSNLLHSKSSDPALIVGPFLAYVWILEERDHFALATDVLQTVAGVIALSPDPAISELGAKVYRRLGDLLLRNRQLDPANDAYVQARTLAETAHNISLVLDARACLGKVQLIRGNLGHAEALVAEVIDEAKTARLLRVESYARRIQGSTMLRRKRPEDALYEFYGAFLVASNDFEREWLLGDMAGCASLLGLRDTARLIHQTLAKTAHSQAVQSLALVNLLEIAVWDNDRVTFDRLWGELMERDLGGDLRLHAGLFAAQGAECWQDTEIAINAYATLAEQAKQAGVHDIEFEALTAVSRLQSQGGQARIGLPAVSFSQPSKIGDITEAIEGMCRLQLSAAC